MYGSSTALLDFVSRIGIAAVIFDSQKISIFSQRFLEFHHGRIRVQVVSPQHTALVLRQSGCKFYA